MNKNSQIEYLKAMFERTYQQCSGIEAYGDMKLFTNRIDVLVVACREMESVESLVIRVGFSDKFDKEVDEIEELRESLIARGMILS